VSKQIPPTKDPPQVLEASKALTQSRRNNFSIGNFLKGVGGAMFGPGFFVGTALNFAFIYSPLKLLYVDDLKSRKTKGSILKTFFSDDRFLEGATKFFEGAFGFGAKNFLKNPYLDILQESKNLLTSFSPTPISFEQLEADREKLKLNG
jgi:hypothetical protein